MINPTLPILLVDDEQKILFSYSLMLKSSGIHNVLSLQDSREVVPFLEKQDVSIIVLDLVMPHISGIELLTQIRLEFPHIPIIVMTALNELEKAVQCMKAGASDYLVKPLKRAVFCPAFRKSLK